MINDTVRLKMIPFFKNVVYEGVVMTQLNPQGHEIKRLWQLVQENIEAGVIVPLTHTVFPMEDTVKALQLYS